MTPFGEKIRELRAKRGIKLKDMAQALGCSSAYLSALEHGKRSKPSWASVQAIITYFNIIWDDAEELQRLADMSDPKVVIDTSGLSPEATLFANRLSRVIMDLPDATLMEMNALLKRALPTQSKI